MPIQDILQYFSEYKNEVKNKHTSMLKKLCSTIIRGVQLMISGCTFKSKKNI